MDLGLTSECSRPRAVSTSAQTRHKQYVQPEKAAHGVSMYRHPEISCIIVITAFLGGCRTEYVARPDVIKRALETPASDKDVAVQVHHYNMDQPPEYVYVSKLRIEKQRSDATRVLSAPDRGGLLMGGGLLLALGGAGIAGGSYLLNQPGSCGAMCSSDARDAQRIVGGIFGGSLIAAGILAAIPGVIMIAKGIPPVTVREGRPDLLYVSETPAQGLPAVK